MTTKFNKTLQILTVFTSLAMLGACSDSTSSETGSEFNGNQGSSNNNTNIDFNKQTLVANLVDHVYLPSVSEFSALASEQALATTAFCNELINSQTVDAELELAAQQSWKQAMSAWQSLEMMQIGPLADNENQLRNQIYSWPVDNQCAVDLDVSYFEVGNIAGTDYNIKTRTSNRRGMDALEHLLFTETLDHSCKSDSLGPQNWNQRPELERKVARCAFAIEVANDISDSALSLENQWLGTNNDGFGQALKSISSSSTNAAFEDIDAVINHLTDALFYLDTITKDAKIGAPIGLITNSCGTATCLKDIESQISKHSLENIKANLNALLIIFQGTSPEQQIAFDDYLIAVGAESLAEQMRADIESAITSIDEFAEQDSFENAVQNNPASIQTLYQNTKKITDNLKSAFIVFLSLQLPSSSAGDAD